MSENFNKGYFMNYCPQCGTAIEKQGQKFCMSCGAQLSEHKNSNPSVPSNELYHLNKKQRLLKEELRRTLRPYFVLLICSGVFYILTGIAFASALDSYVGWWQAFSSNIGRVFPSGYFQNQIDHEFIPAIVWIMMLQFVVLVIIAYISHVTARYGAPIPNGHRIGVLLIAIFGVILGILGFVNVTVLASILTLLDHGLLQIAISTFLCFVAIAFAVQNRWQRRETERAIVAKLADIKTFLSESAN